MTSGFSSSSHTRLVAFLHTKHRHKQYIQFNKPIYLLDVVFFGFFPFFVYLFCQIDAKKCTYGSRVDSGKKTTTKYDGRNKMQTWKCISKTTVNTTKSAHSRSNGVTDLIWIQVEIKKSKNNNDKISCVTVPTFWCQLATISNRQTFKGEKLLWEPVTVS